MEDMMWYLDLEDDELDGVIIREEEVKKFEAYARWLAIGKLNTSRAVQFIGDIREP